MEVLPFENEERATRKKVKLTLLYACIVNFSSNPILVASYLPLRRKTVLFIRKMFTDGAGDVNYSEEAPDKRPVGCNTPSHGIDGISIAAAVQLSLG